MDPDHLAVKSRRDVMRVGRPADTVELLGALRRRGMRRAHKQNDWLRGWC